MLLELFDHRWGLLKFEFIEYPETSVRVLESFLITYLEKGFQFFVVLLPILVYFLIIKRNDFVLIAKKPQSSWTHTNDKRGNFVQTSEHSGLFYCSLFSMLKKVCSFLPVLQVCLIFNKHKLIFRVNRKATLSGGQPGLKKSSLRSLRYPRWLLISGKFAWTVFDSSIFGTPNFYDSRYPQIIGWTRVARLRFVLGNISGCKKNIAFDEEFPLT